MKIRKEELFNALEFIKKVNDVDFKKLDLSELYYGIDLSEIRKDELMWIHEYKTNFELLEYIIETKTKIH